MNNMKTEIMSNTIRTFNRAGLQIKKHSPEILMVAGVVGTVASTVLACRATTKVSAILDEKNKTVNAIHQCLEADDVEYTEEDSKKDLTITYAQTGMKIAKLYAPAVALSVLSITSIVSSHHILKKRNLALAAAYAVVDKGFKDYRNRVIERFGEQLDKELRYNIKAKEVEEIVVDENGNQTVEKKIVNVADASFIEGTSQYARFFDEASPEWQKDSEYNLMFLRRQQEYSNEVLRARGHIFLNEVYDMLGIPRSKAGQVVGWVYERNGDERQVGDNYVDFGIYNPKNEAGRMFVNGIERNILLDFNVDGVIYDKI